MSWCTKCKAEYIDGIESCSTCGAMLVDELPDSVPYVPFMQGEEKVIQKLVGFLEYAGLKTYCKYDEESNFWIAYVKENEIDEATKYNAAYMKAEMDKERDNENDDESKSNDSVKSTSQLSYVKKEDKYKELVSSAYSFIAVGVLGIILLSMQISGLLGINLDPSGKYLVYSVMGAVFIAFLIIGILTFKRSKIVFEEAKVENEFTIQINEWLSSNITVDKISDNVSEDDSDEIIYFKRSEKIKELLIEHFGELDDSYLDKLVDDFYLTLIGE